jgi:hypothetical protein
MGRELSDKSESDIIKFKGKTVVSLSGGYSSFSEVFIELVKKAGYQIGDEVEYLFSIRKKSADEDPN